MATMKQITEDARKFVAMHKAAYSKQAIAGESPDSYPGADHDKPIPEGAKAPNPEVKQDLPPGGTSTSGATDSEKLEMGHALNATQSAGESVKKEPLITSDANADAKTGSAKMANDLLGAVKKLQDNMDKKAAAPAAVKKADESIAKPTDGKPEGSKDKSEPENAKAPAPEKKPEIAKSEDTTKTKEAGQLELTQDVLAKIASCILSSEEGWKYAETALTKAAGAEAARTTIKTLQKQAEDYEKQAAYEQGKADADYMKKQAEAERLYAKGASDAVNMANMVLQKEAQLRAVGMTDAQLVKLGQAIADESMEGAGAPGAEQAMAGMEAPAEGGGDGISTEELAQALAELVQEGKCSPEDAQAVMEYIQSAGGGQGGAPEGGAPEGGMPPGMEGGAPPSEGGAPGGEAAPAPPTEEEPAEEEGKEKDKAKKEGAANTLKASLLEAIKTAKANAK